METILVIEDDIIIFNDIKELLKSNFEIIAYRDLVSFSNDYKEIERESPKLIILDIRMAEHLENLSLEQAPRWGGEGKIPDNLKEKYLDNEIGLKIGDLIRRGEFKGIDKNVLILFLTARQNGDVKEWISRIGRSKHIQKPIFYDELNNIVQAFIDEYA